MQVSEDNIFDIGSKDATWSSSHLWRTGLERTSLLMTTRFKMLLKMLFLKALVMWQKGKAPLGWNRPYCVFCPLQFTFDVNSSNTGAMQPVFTGGIEGQLWHSLLLGAGLTVTGLEGCSSRHCHLNTVPVIRKRGGPESTRSCSWWG